MHTRVHTQVYKYIPARIHIYIYIYIYIHTYEYIPAHIRHRLLQSNRHISGGRNPSDIGLPCTVQYVCMYYYTHV
jgi:hypothetical protein